MSLRGPLGQVLLLLLIIGLGVAGFLTLYEKRSVEDWIPPRARVLREPYLAAERMLQQLKVPMSHVSALQQAAELPANSVLILPAGRVGVTDQARAAVRQYVAAGGHLLIESESWEDDDPLLGALGVERSEAPYVEYADDFFTSWKDLLRDPTDPVDLSDPAILLVQWNDGEAPLLVTSLGGELLSAEDATREIHGEDGIRMLQRPLGEGLITAVNDISFAQNWRIGRNDNAELFWRILNERPDLAHVAWFRARPAQLWPWLWTHALPVLVTLALIIGLLIWQGLPRFGPIMADPSNQRRRLSDHLSASGRFLWSAGQRANLSRAAAACAYDAAARRYPHLRSMSADDQVAFLCRRFQLPPGHATQLVRGASLSDANELLRLTRSCRHLHRALSGAEADSNELIDEDHR